MDMIRDQKRAPLTSAIGRRVNLLNVTVPADGIAAAVNWQDFGMSRWQLGSYATSLAGRLKWGGDLFWPISAAARHGRLSG
jgi:hypothetical protein